MKPGYLRGVTVAQLKNAGIDDATLGRALNLFCRDPLLFGLRLHFSEEWCATAVIGSGRAGLYFVTFEHTRYAVLAEDADDAAREVWWTAFEAKCEQEGIGDPYGHIRELMGVS